ncbi:MAG: DUF1800 domain-containing protein [Planctomycetes bacterium]|nr:DUF1800 domain-containing protein [Planctomycetota bacterium]
MIDRRAFLIASGGACVATLGACGPLDTLVGGFAPADARFLAPESEPIDLVQHVLARCTFGPRPGDRAALLALAPGDPRAAVEAWIERQLAPETRDDDAAERAVRRFDSLSAPVAELYEYKPRVLLRELTSAAVLRASASRRDLQQVLVEFWNDHFNVDSSKGECAWLCAAHDRDVIRAHALGSFRDLLGAAALGPAMLWYLDGRVNVKRRSDERPNENYARELLELHTLGVHGGYTQADVMEAARCLTGWTVRDKTGLRKARVEFLADAHDDGEKSVLGERFPAGGGERDARQLLDLVARHPSTARHVARKLCVRFIADEPPPAAVAAVARAFERSAGDLRATLRALFALPEFRGDEHEFAALRGAKLKRPFHYLVSILRATGAETDAGEELCAYLARMGQAPFQHPTPDGPALEASAWQGALFWRWKLASAVASNRIEGTRVDLGALVSRAGGADALLAHFLGRRATSRERRVLVADGANSPELGLLLAAPAFQRC